MKYKPYPKYKDSGVVWLGEIPEGWECKRLRFLAKLNPSKSAITDNHPDEVSFLPMDNIGDNGTLRLDTIKAWDDVESGYTYFAEGDVTYAIITPCFENGKGAQMLGLKNKMGFGTTELCVLRPNHKCDGRWLWYTTISTPFRKIGESWMYGAGGQKRVPDDFARNFAIGFPPLYIQRAIAAFLDAETARIDGLIKDYEDLIELLKEKRQALISRAVTCGLSELVSPDDPEFGEWAKPVKFKDSGVEWIGEIPEGWNIWKVAHTFITSSGTTPPADEEKWYEGTIPWITTGELREATITKTEKCVTEEAVKQFSALKLVPIDSLLIAMYGATIGRLARNAVPATTNQACCALTPKSVAVTTFAFFYFQFAKDYLILLSSGGGQPNISQEKIRSFPIPLPPLTTQHAVASFLEMETSKIDTLVSESESAIELLKEHRSALITNAVTGKINVEVSA